MADVAWVGMMMIKLSTHKRYLTGENAQTTLNPSCLVAPDPGTKAKVLVAGLGRRSTSKRSS